MSGRIVYGEDSEEEETDEESSSEEEQHEQTPDHQVALPLEESQSPSPSSPQTQGQEEPPVAAQDQHIKESSLLSSTSSVSPSSLDQQGHHPQQQTRDDTAAKKGSTSGTQTGSPIITEGVERQSVTSIHGSTPVSLSSSSSSSSSVSSPAVPSSSSASPPPETPVMRNLRIKMNRLDRCIRKSVYDHYARMDATTDKVSRLHSKTLAYVQDISANVQMANRDLHTLSQLIRSHHDPDYRPPLHMHSKQQQEHLKALHIPKNSLFMQSVKLPGVDKSRHTLRNQ